MSNGDRYDAIVVGAGPAGNLAAYKLATAGCRVLLLEKEKLPRYKACGGGVVLRAAQALPFPLPEGEAVVADRISQLRLTLNLDRPFLLERDPPPLLMTMRSAFDEFTARRAVEAGASLKDGLAVRRVEESRQEVRCETAAGVFVGQFLIAADGANSIVARSTAPFRPPACGVALEAELYLKTDRLLAGYVGRAEFDFNVLPRGYGWIFPKADHLSAGVFTQHARLPDIRRHCEVYLQRKGLAGEVAHSLVRGHPVPLGPPTRRLHSERILLAGDAAGLVDPLTGEGISYAIRSGLLAADSILESLRAPGTSLASYSAGVRASLVPDIKLASLAARPLYWFPFLSYRSLERNRALGQGLIDVFEGKTTYGKLLRKLVWKPFGIV